MDREGGPLPPTRALIVAPEVFTKLCLNPGNSAPLATGPG